MKKIFYILLTLILVALFGACNPIENREDVGDLITSVDQVNATVTQVLYNGFKTNKVSVHCTSPVNCQWTDSVNTYCSTDTAVILLVKGTQTITLTALAADGTRFTKNFDVTVDSMRYPVPPQYGYFCGTGKKTWVWADTKCFGNGGDSDLGPAWWILNPSDITDQCSGKDLPADGIGASMNFVLKGKKMIKTSADGSSTTGKFSFDMTNIKKVGWSIGKLTFSNTNILCGYDFNATGYTAWSEYDIIYLDDNKMILGAQEHAPNTNYWYWVFKAQ